MNDQTSDRTYMTKVEGFRFPILIAEPKKWNLVLVLFWKVNRNTKVVSARLIQGGVSVKR